MARDLVVRAIVDGVPSPARLCKTQAVPIRLAFIGGGGPQ